MKVVWTEAAEDDLADIYRYYARQSGSDAIARKVNRVIVRKVNRVIVKAGDGLYLFPRMGRIGHYPGTRERFTARYNYRIVYEIIEADQIINILRVIHGSRQWPPVEE